jgi:hypothetical protein
MQSGFDDSTAWLKPLRTGFIFSLVSLALFAFYSLGFYLFYGTNLDAIGFFWFYIFPFVILFIWAFGASRRARGWNLAGQKYTASILSLSWKVNFVFILPIPVFLSLLSFGALPSFSLPLPLLVAVVTTVAWGYSTFLEARGLKKLDENNKASLRLPRVCSLLGILVYACSILIYTYLSFVYGMNNILYSFVFPPYGYFSILTSSLLLASPLLMISCITAIIRLKKNDQSTNCSLTRAP